MNVLDLMPAVLIFGVFVVLVLLPQMREKREHDSLLSGLAKGDKVVTQGGIHGSIAVVGTETVELEVGEGTRITVDKSTIARRAATAKA